MKYRPVVQVDVFNHEGRRLRNAHMALTQSNGRRRHHLSFDSGLMCHTAADVEPGSYLLTAQAPLHTADQRPVTVSQRGLRTTIVLGSPGLPFFYRGDVKVPFQPYPDLVALALHPKSTTSAMEHLAAISEHRNLTEIQIPPQNARIFQFAPEATRIDQQQIWREVAAVNGIIAIGPVVRLDDKGVSFLSDELVVKFLPHVDRRTIVNVARTLNLQELRGFVQAQNTFLFSILGIPNYEMLDIARKLVESGPVDYAEPNLITATSPSDSSINPTDFLFPMQWHLPLIRCPEAWQVIRDQVSPSSAMGSPDIIIAIVDWGIDVDNPEFAGTISSGKPKIYKAFDFQNMVPNNHARARAHGTCCAGVATALANDDGVCGVAGNCRLMAIRRPDGDWGKETAYPDMYLWIAGFESNSKLGGFLTQLVPALILYQTVLATAPELRFRV